MDLQSQVIKHVSPINFAGILMKTKKKKQTQTNQLKQNNLPHNKKKLAIIQLFSDEKKKSVEKHA